MTESEFDKEKLYNTVVHFYIDKKGYSKEQANLIAQRVVKREVERRICANPECGHQLADHIRNTDTCLVPTCDCAKFEPRQASKGAPAPGGKAAEKRPKDIAAR